MARLCAVANGDNTSASTWALIDSTSFSESETSSFTVPVSYATTYTTFTPGAITIDAIAIRIRQRFGTTGTLKVELYNTTDAASVAGTEVTVNTSDIVDAGATTEGGWMLFQFSSVTLTAGKAYIVRFKTSTSTQVSVYGTLTTNPNRFLRTTTTQAPVAGDDRFVLGEWTAAATTTTRTVTLNDISTVDYGSASTSVVTPALSISNGGIVLTGTTASTTYVQKISGNVVVYNGGILRIGTSGSRMPTSSSFTWTFDCVANVDFGIDVRRKGEFTAYGEVKQRWTTLTADKVATNTVIAVTSTSGWKNGDTVVFSGTGTNVAHSETKTISTVDSSTQITLTAGLTNAHTGTGDCVGEIGNLNSNVKIVGTSTTVGTFVTYAESSISVLDNVEVQYFGSSTSNRSGVEAQHINTSTNSATFTSCSFRDNSANAGIVVLQASGGSGNGAYYTITDNLIYYTTAPNAGFIVSAGGTGTPTFTITGNCVIGNGSGGIGMTLRLVTGGSGICTTHYISGFSTGLTIGTTLVQDTVTDLSSFKIHSNSIGFSSSSGQKKTCTSFDFVSNQNGVSSINGPNTFTTCNFFGASVCGYNVTAQSSLNCYVTFNSCVFRGRTSFDQPIGVRIANIYSAITRIEFNLCSFGTTIAHTTADVSFTAFTGGQFIFNSCTFASSTEFAANLYTFLDDFGYVGVQRKDDTDGSHQTFVKQAIITPDTTFYRSATPGLRITPKSATITCSTKLFPFKIRVNNGQTCTPSIYVRESVSGDGTDYNGNRTKLYVKTNYSAGITSDTLLATATVASEGGWEKLTGTTAAVTDDVVLEFYVLLDGTTGWVTTDDFSATVS